MASSLGSRTSNRVLMGLIALGTVLWSVWRLVDYGRSSTIEIAAELQRHTPAVDLFGGRLEPGNVVELSVDKLDTERLSGMIDVFRYSEIVVGLVLILVGMAFLFRFCDRVIDGRAFGKGAQLDVAVVAGTVVLFPFCTGLLHQMSTNSVINTLGMTDVLDAARSFTGTWIAIGVAAFLQFVYAALQQGTQLAEDTEGLV